MSKDSEHDTQQEGERLTALRRYDILDTPPEAAYDDVTQMACSICDTPVALVTLVDEDRQWFKSRVGFDLAETARAISFCSVAIEDDGILVVPDTAKDERFCRNALVTGPCSIGSYAGAPLITPDGYRIGTVCVIDNKPRQLSADQLEALRSLSRQVITNLELRRSLKLTAAARDALATEIEHRVIAEESRRRADSFMRSTLDSLADNIAIIDRHGDVVHVNDAWSRFAEENCTPEVITKTGKGANYLAVCAKAEQAGCAEAVLVSSALRKVLAKQTNEVFQLEYPCHAPQQKRWFVVQVSAFGTGSNRHAVVSHRNVTARKLADEQVRTLNKSLEQRVQERTADLEKTYETLFESEERLRGLFDNASVGIIVGDVNGNLLRVNEAYLSLAGCARQQALGRNLEEFLDDHDRNALRRQLAELAQGKTPGFKLDLRSGGVARQAGQWLNLSLTAVRDPDGSITQFIGLVQDLKDFKESELQRNMVFNRSLDMMVIASLTGKFLTPNKSCSRILGYSNEELQALNYLDLIHEDDRDCVHQSIAALGEGRSVSLLDTRMRTRDGDFRDIVWNAVPWTEPGLFLAVGRDLTSMRAAERKLNEQRLMLQRAEQMAQIGSWQYDLGRRVVTCSDGLQAIAQRENPSSEVALDELLKFVAHEDRELLTNSIRLVSNDQAPRRIQCHVLRPDGSIRIVQTSIDVVRDTHGEIYGVIGACLDITDINRTVEQLRESENKLRAFGQKLEQIREDERISISREIHDELGQMLTALKIDLTLLVRDVADPVEAAPDAPEIVAALKSMEKLVDSTIKSVRLIATQLRPEVLDAFGLIPAIQWHASEFERRTEIKCTVDAPAVTPLLSADSRISLFRITQEAMTNVARHANASQIMITIALRDRSIVLTIADDGDGFDPQQLETATSLGVLGMRERATMIGGTFAISCEPGRGTCVQVQAPLRAEAQHRSGQAVSA
ncbi:MAG: PAS domain S-box protein [Woeseia sp.]